MGRSEPGPNVRRLLLAPCGLIVAIVAGAAWLFSTQAEPGVTRGMPAEVPLATDKTLGVNADLSRLSRLDRELALASMEAGGFRWLRQRFAWDAIEPEPGRFDWSVWDEIVMGAQRHGLQLLVVLDGSPAWARSQVNAANPYAPPIESRDYGAFVAAVAARYADEIDYYEIWDEPNIAPHWGAQEIDPAAYVHLLRDGAIQIRAVDPGAVILLAALAPNVESGGANMSDLLFLNALYEHQGAEWFDAVAVQPYDFGLPLDAPPDPGQLNWRRPELLREVMVSNEDEATGLWAVGFGLMRSEPNAVTEALGQARRSWAWLGPMIWTAWSEQDAHGEYALRDAAGGFGQAYEALVNWAQSPAVAWPGAYPAAHGTGHYWGDWRVTGSGADIGRTGDRLEIPFDGTRLALKVRRGDYRAFLFASIDGKPANGLPHDGQGRAYLVLYDPLGRVDTVTVARGLPVGAHVAEFVAEGGWGQWAILGWSVAQESPEQAPWLPLALGGVACMGMAVAVAWAWLERCWLLDAAHTLLERYQALDGRVTLALTASGAILLWIGDGTVESLLALGLVSVLLLLRPGCGLPLVAVSLPFYQLGKPLFGKVFSMAELLTLLTAAAWAANHLLRWLYARQQHAVARTAESPAVAPTGTGMFRPVQAHDSTACPEPVLRSLTAIDGGVIALVGLGAISLLWAEHGREAAREFRTVVLEASMFYALLRGLVREPAKGWLVADAWIVGAVLISTVGLTQWAIGWNLIAAEGVWRVRGFYGSPNNLALYLGRLLPLAISVGLWGRPGRRKWLYGIAALAMAAAIVLSRSRGAWLLGVPVSLLFLAAMRGRRALVPAIGAVLTLAVVALLFLGPGRVESLLDTARGTTFFRLALWQSSLSMVRDHPVLGVGLDNFLYHYRTRYVLPVAWEEFNLSHPHNIVLDFWLRIGFPAVLALGWLLVAFFRRGWETYRRSGSEVGGGQSVGGGEWRWLVLGLMGGMVYVVAHGMVDNSFFLVDLAFAFMIMLALIQVPVQAGRTAAA